jgi:hypothetical protein
MWPFTKKPSYSKNLDILVALVTHLGYTDWNARSTKGLAKAVGNTEIKVSKVLDEFKSLFRKSSYKSPKGLTYYQLHVRHALRWKDEIEEEDEKVNDKLPLEPATVNALLDFIVKSADQERRHSLGYFSSWIAASVAIGGALLTIFFRTKC